MGIHWPNVKNRVIQMFPTFPTLPYILADIDRSWDIYWREFIDVVDAGWGDEKLAYFLLAYFFEGSGPAGAERRAAALQAGTITQEVIGSLDTYRDSHMEDG